MPVFLPMSFGLSIWTGLVLLLSLSALEAAPISTCTTNTLSITGHFDTAQFEIEIADTPQKRTTGLMFRDHLDENHGMLFVYEAAQKRFFWMKNTPIALDIIFADATGKVIRVHHNAQPYDETPIPSKMPAKYVLEINAGLAAKIGIKNGAILSHSLINPKLNAQLCA